MRIVIVWHGLQTIACSSEGAGLYNIGPAFSGRSEGWGKLGGWMVWDVGGAELS